MKHRLAWSLAGVVAGGVMGLVWVMGLMFVEQTFTLDVVSAFVVIETVVLLLCWVFVIAPFVMLFREVSWVYSPRHAWWIGGLAGTAVYLTISGSLGSLENLGRDSQRMSEAVVYSSGPMLVGATVAMTISFLHGLDMRKPGENPAK